MSSASKSPGFAYQAVYRYLLELIESSACDAALKLPSQRQLAARLSVSVSTVKYAYGLLEDEGRVEARPKLGYYTRPQCRPVPGEPSPSLIDRVFASARQPGMLALSSDAPAMLLSLEHPLLMMERELLRQYPRSPSPLYQPFGEPELRSALAGHYTRSTEDYWQADQVFIGSDLRSVLGLALQALGLCGSVALVESPCSWAVLRELQAAQIRIVEVPLDEAGRFDLSAVRALLENEPIRLAVLSSTVSIPHGSLMPAEDKRQICDWLAERDVWLFENDSYGEYCFVDAAPRYRDFADPQRLLVFSTFDKLIGAEAPYGYVLCRQQGAPLRQRFLEQAFRLSPIRQKALARLFGSPRLERHLTNVRALLLARMQQLKALLDAQGADLWRVTAPSGGAAFWLEVRRPVDLRLVFERLLARHIVIAPGEMFSQQGHWQRHLRLSYTLDWSKDIAQAVGHLAQAIRDEPQRP